MRTGASRSIRRLSLLTVVGALAMLLTACTGRGGGYLSPGNGFTGQASFGFTFSCEDKGGINPPTGQLRIELSYTDGGRRTSRRQQAPASRSSCPVPRRSRLSSILRPSSTPEPAFSRATTSPSKTVPESMLLKLAGRVDER